MSFLLEDAVWCDWLYREFDGQRVPRRLFRRPSRFGNPYPERLSISPDPADPAELENYSESLQSAQHLILVISPASGKSSIIEEHLRIFRAAGGNERIIALVVKGEPASPAAEPGSADDGTWMPRWLACRFENNHFRAADATEPLVIDARMGMSSLAEARAAMLAALLEVDREALTELGIVMRPTTSLIEFPTRASLLNVPPPTPSNIAFLEIATEHPTPRRQSSVMLWVCAFAALVALAVLGLWPTQNMLRVPNLELRQPLQASEVPALALDLPLVEARPLLDTPLSFLPPPGAASETPPAPLAATPTEPDPEIPRSTVSTGPSRAEQTAVRDRFTRLAESRMAEGNSIEALEILGHAVEAGTELLLYPDATPADSVDLSMLYRRAGTLAEGLAQLTEARKHYGAGWQVLMDLRAREELSREAMHMLADLDSRLRQLRL